MTLVKPADGASASATQNFKMVFQDNHKVIAYGVTTVSKFEFEGSFAVGDYLSGHCGAIRQCTRCLKAENTLFIIQQTENFLVLRGNLALAIIHATRKAQRIYYNL